MIEAHSLPGEAIEVGRLDSRIVISDVIPSEVVGQDEDDVGR